MRNLICLIFMVTFGCSKYSNESANTPRRSPVVTLIYYSETKDSLDVSKDYLFTEQLNSEDWRFTIGPGDTVNIALNDSVQLIYTSVRHSELPYDTLLVGMGDSVLIRYTGSNRKNYVLHEGNMNEVMWSSSFVFPPSHIRKEMDGLDSLFLRFEKAVFPPGLYSKSVKGTEGLIPVPNIKYKERWNESMNKLIQLGDIYYGKLTDSFSQMADAKHKLYADLVKLRQYNELKKYNAVVKDTVLSQKLLSDRYINQTNFESRYLLHSVFPHYINNLPGRALTGQYDFITADLPKNIREYMKYVLIREMVYSKYDRKTIIAYMDKYKTEFGSNRLLEELMSEVEYGVMESDDLKLVSFSNEITTWENVKKQWLGKVIYVDFWASWCAPCIRAMPYSHELKNKYKDVVFVYLALNDQHSPWEKMSIRQNITENGYLITNSKSSKFITGNRITSIPRYIIYDKAGNLVNSDAPGPDKIESEEQLKMFLK